MKQTEGNLTASLIRDEERFRGGMSQKKRLRSDVLSKDDKDEAPFFIELIM